MRRRRRCRRHRCRRRRCRRRRRAPPSPPPLGLAVAAAAPDQPGERRGADAGNVTFIGAASTAATTSSSCWAPTRRREAGAAALDGVRAEGAARRRRCHRRPRHQGPRHRAAHAGLLRVCVYKGFGDSMPTATSPWRRTRVEVRARRTSPPPRRRRRRADAAAAAFPPALSRPERSSRRATRTDGDAHGHRDPSGGNVVAFRPAAIRRRAAEGAATAVLRARTTPSSDARCPREAARAGSSRSAASDSDGEKRVSSTTEPPARGRGRHAAATDAAGSSRRRHRRRRRRRRPGPSRQVSTRRRSDEKPPKLEAPTPEIDRVSTAPASATMPEAYL